MLTNLYEYTLAILFPRRCPCCGETVAWNAYFCEQCRETLKPFPYPRLLKAPEGSDGATAAFIYTGAARQAVVAVKFRAIRYFSAFLADAMAAKAKEAFPDVKFDMLIPVPISRRRRATRGYNQSEWLANGIARLLSIPKAYNLLMKVKDNNPQHRLTRKERLVNVKGAYKVKYTGQLAGKTILLADDVLTTGSTVSECAKTLKTAGAKKVCVLCAAAARTGEKTLIGLAKPKDKIEKYFPAAGK